MSEVKPGRDRRAMQPVSLFQIPIVNQLAQSVGKMSQQDLFSSKGRDATELSNRKLFSRIQLLRDVAIGFAS